MSFIISYVDTQEYDLSYLPFDFSKKDANSDSQVWIDDQSFGSQTTSILLYPLMHVEKPHN